MQDQELGSKEEISSLFLDMFRYMNVYFVCSRCHFKLFYHLLFRAERLMNIIYSLFFYLI